MARAALLSDSDLDPSVSINLSRLLSRLESNLLDPTSSSRTTSFERIRDAANLEYARTLLIKLEQEASGSKSAGSLRSQNVKRDLVEKRQKIKVLNERLYELNQLDDDNTVGDAIVDDEDLLAAMGSSPVSVHEGESIESQDLRQSQGHQPPSVSQDNTTQSQIRSRRGQEPYGNDGAITTSSDAAKQISPTDGSLASTEALLSHNSSEQETLTNSLLSMASALKASSNAFASSLEAEKEVLNNTVSNLEKNSSGMEAAEKRMGALRRATEGKGWLGRMLMYAYIFGLVVIAILIVGVMPKLRF